MCLRLGILTGCYENCDQTSCYITLEEYLVQQKIYQVLDGFTLRRHLKTPPIFTSYSVCDVRICADYLCKDTDRENRSSRRKTCPSSKLSALNSTCTGLGLNPRLRGKKSVTTALPKQVKITVRFWQQGAFRTFTEQNIHLILNIVFNRKLRRGNSGLKGKSHQRVKASVCSTPEKVCRWSVLTLHFLMRHLVINKNSNSEPNIVHETTGSYADCDVSQFVILNARDVPGLHYVRSVIARSL